MKTIRLFKRILQALKSSKDLTSDWNAEEGVVRLSIRRVYPEDEGEYSCVIHNDSVRYSTSACLVVDGKCLILAHVARINIFLFCFEIENRKSKSISLKLPYGTYFLSFSTFAIS